MQQLVVLEVNSQQVEALANNLLPVVQQVDLEEDFQWESLKAVLDLAKDNLKCRTATVCSVHQNYRLQICLDHPRLSKRIIMQTTDSLMLEAQERNADK